MEAITTAAQLIQLGEAKTVLAGGTESMSRIPLLYNRGGDVPLPPAGQGQDRRGSG